MDTPIDVPGNPNFPPRCNGSANDAARRLSRRDGREVTRLPGLDGLRAISIVAVLLAHADGTGNFRVPTLLGDLGNLGVRVFFVISGFLITHLLLKERSQTGRTSLKGFYIRRTFRIMPAFYAFLLGMGVLHLAGVVAFDGSNFIWASTFTINYVESKPWVLGHLWSLAVEEQFYLLWPIAFVCFSTRTAGRILIGAIAAAPILRVLTWYCFPGHESLLTKSFPTVCDAIATGCALAWFRESLWNHSFYRKVLQRPVFLIIPIAVLAANYLASHTRPDLLVGQTIRNIGIALCIDWTLRNSTGVIGRFLNAKPVAWVGVLSYSMYLWQQPFLNRNSASPFCMFPLNVVLATLCAVGSYYFIERPFLRLRGRLFSKRKSVGSPASAYLDNQCELIPTPPEGACNENACGRVIETNAQ